MDYTQRKMTKIAREVSKFTVQTMKEEGIGTAEFDYIHFVRHHPGCTQVEVRDALKIDKGAAARRASNLEAKGYLCRKPHPTDGRSQLLFATEKAESLKNSKAHIESIFYDWLLAELPEAERDAFCQTLDTLYWRSKKQRQAGFPDVMKLVQLADSQEGGTEEDAEKKDNYQSDRVLSYFRREWTVLLIVTIFGLIYNLGLLTGPWFEGRLVGCLVNILNGSAVFSDMLVLAIGYVVAIAVVQSSRYIKRFYVRRFANNVNRNMKCILYRNLVQKSRVELQEEGTGNLLTKAILDVDDCVEGMRKFTTEIFDTGVALAAYACMLLYYDWKLALLCMLFPPISYVLAEKMKVFVQCTGAAYKVQSGILSSATMDRASNALTYRVFGRESDRRQAYEQTLMDYEHSAVRANAWTSVMPPIYRIISMTGVLFLIYFGIRNVQGNGWANWNVAIFTTFLTCFTKLSTKSSSAAKLFNAVHKAQVSWKRIRPLMHPAEESAPADVQPAKTLSVQDLAFTYPNGTLIFSGLSFDAVPGQIIGVTGPVACGKSTLGKAFLCESPYDGSIRIGGKELSSFSDVTRTGTIGYLGHDPELFQDTVENNILMGDALDANTYLKLVCLKEEADAMEQGIQTFIGTGGVRLSGGQAKRLALARTFAHMRPVLILDDPFSALDRTTEEQIFANLKMLTKNSIVLLISHRLYQFPEMDQVIWMNEGHTVVGTHEQLLQSVPEYAALYDSQKGDSHEEH